MPTLLQQPKTLIDSSHERTASGINVAQILWLLGFVSIAAGLLTMMLPHGWGKTPVFLRFLCGLFTFGLTPGYLIFALMHRKTPSTSGFLHALLEMLVLSFACNLGLNIVLFAVQCSFSKLAMPYLICQLVGFLTLAVHEVREKRWTVVFSPMEVSFDRASRFLLGFCILLCSAVLVITYQMGAVAVSPEELIVLRKLAENSHICFNNISSSIGEPSTYFFVPFQLFIVGVAFVSRLDVSSVYSIFWCVTSGVSIASLICLSSGYSQQRLAFISMAFLCALISFFDAKSVIYDIGIITPYPNRYGFAHGVLLPLNLFILCSLLKERFTKPVHIALLVYLTVEMTFVHARETVLLLGCTVAIVLVSLLSSRQRRRELTSLGIVLVATCSILFAYKTLNAWAAEDLTKLLSMYHEQTYHYLRNLVDKNGLLGSLFTSGPNEIVYQLQRFGISVPTEVTSYRQIFVDSWAPDRWPATSRIILPLCLLALPVYILRSRSVLELAFSLSLSVLALISASGLLKLTISFLVGSPEVLCYYNLVYILAFCITAHMVALTASWLVESSNSSRFGWAAVLGCLITVLCLSFVGSLSNGTINLQQILHKLWTPSFGIAVHLLAMVALIIKVVRNSSGNLAILPDVRLPVYSGRAVTVAALMVLIMLAPTIFQSPAWSRTSYRFDTAPHKFTGNFSHDYDLNIKKGGLPGYLPLSIICFLRSNIPEHSNILCGNSIAILDYANHFAPIMTVNGYIGPSFICNWEYIQKYQQAPGPFVFVDFLRGKDGQILEKMLQGLAVDYVVIGPEESARVDDALSHNEHLSQRLRTIFRADGYLVLQFDKGLSRHL